MAKSPKRILAKKAGARKGRYLRASAEARERCAAVEKMLRPYGVKRSGANCLVVQTSISPEEVASRLARLKKAKVPLTGLVSKIGRSEPKFKALIARYDRLRGVKTGFTERQSTVFDFLQEKKVSQKLALELVKSQRPPDLERKIAFFEAQKLDPAVHGVERIPVSHFEGKLKDKLSKIKRFGLNAILLNLEREHAKKMLDLLLPSWKKFSTLKTVAPPALLERVKAALAMGIRPSPHVLYEYSAKSIRLGKASAPHSLDSKGVRAHIVRFGNRKWNKVRLLIVDTIISRPHLSVSMNWLENDLHKSHGISRAIFLNRLEELSDWGILSRKGGYITIGPWYRKARTA